MNPVYVEIGVRGADTIRRVAPLCKEAHGVDPMVPPTTEGFTYHQQTSDEFFAGWDGFADLVFIDGDHDAAQVCRDVQGAERVLSRDGLIVLHDTWPVEFGNTSADVCGTAYTVAQNIEAQVLWNVVTVRAFPGLTLIQRPHTDRFGG